MKVDPEADGGEGVADSTFRTGAAALEVEVVKKGGPIRVGEVGLSVSE